MAMTLEEALAAALDDEYRARATYRAVLGAYGEVRPFVNIVESEERHIEALHRLCERYDVKVSPDPYASRIPAPESLEAACEAALQAERENATLARERGGGAEGGGGGRGGGRQRRRRHRGGHSSAET